MCGDCLSGRYQDENNYEGNSCSAWRACSAGKYVASSPAASTSNDRTCVDCSSGQFQTSDTSTATSCAFCQKGRAYGSVTTACTQCVSGKFQDQSTAASASCKFCRVGYKYTSATTSCVQCPASKYQDLATELSAACKNCQTASHDDQTLVRVARRKGHETRGKKRCQNL